MNRKSLNVLRDELRKKDREIVRLLNERAGISLQVGSVKNAEGRDIYDPSQERRVHDFAARINRGPLADAAIRNIFREILSSSRALQGRLPVSYLGPEASFTHLAALSRFGASASFEALPTIRRVFDSVERGKAGWGVVPLENSSEGSVKETLSRLIETPLRIRGEIFLKISQCLLAKGGTLEAIRRVYSHPQAFAQCLAWLERHLPGVETVEASSTAAAALRARRDRRAAAIGSRLAADSHGLVPLAEGIEDSASNTTRFIIVGNGGCRRTGRDRTSILFATPHAPGSLYSALEPFARAEINLTRIESHPIHRRMWEYLFFVDFSGHENERKVRRCLEDLGKKTTLIKLLGSYPRGEEPA